VVEAMLLPQRNGSAHTDIESEDVCKAMYDFRDIDGDLRFWWHSHVQMGVFWSGTDMTAIRDFGAAGWVVCTVFNQKREMKSAFYSKDGLTTPWGSHELFYDDLDTKIETTPPLQAWEDEYVTNVKEKKFSPMEMLPAYARHWESEGSVVGELSEAEWSKMKKRIKKAEKKAKKITLNVDAAGFNEYGFDQEEMSALAKEGFDIMTIDSLIENDFTPKEILELCNLHADPTDVMMCLASHWTPLDVMTEYRSLESKDDLDAAIERGNYGLTQ
jgi:hypothetical protein